MTEVSSKSDSKKSLQKSNELDPCHSTLMRAGRIESEAKIYLCEAKPWFKKNPPLGV